MTVAKKSLPVATSSGALPAKWNHKAYGSIADPVHKSHLSTLIGDYACTEQFRRDRIRELRGEQRQTCSGKTEMGTAAHETIARALRVDDVRQALLTGQVPVTPSSVRAVLLDEFARATAGREVVWHGKAEQADVVDDTAAMVFGLFKDLHRHVAKVELVEAGWIAPAGKYWTEGHIDLVYRPRENPDALAITDWKTGATKPHQIQLDHGFESGLYSAALYRGLFLPTHELARWRGLARTDPAMVPLDMADVEALSRPEIDDRAAMHIALRALARMSERGECMPKGVVTFGEFPQVIRLTHLADYVPYQRAGKKKVERPEEVSHWGALLGSTVSAGDEVKYTAGMARGPAWYRVKRTADDVSRLETRLRTIVGWVRMGLFVDAVGEKCARCSYRDSCLTSGYQAQGEEAKTLTSALKGLGLEGLEMEL